jgi:purine-nucleoside phosphorylase
METPAYGFEQITDSAAFIQSRCPGLAPRAGFVLGTGLSGFAESVTPLCEIPYSEIPHFPLSTVASHRGKLILGEAAGIPVAVLAGRFHYYEGYSMKQATFPIRVLKALGISHLLLSNAAGSINGNIDQGDIVFVRDHINLLPENPLRGHNDERLGPRFPDMLGTYSEDLNQLALEIAKRVGARAHKGVYVALQGPNLETPAEYEFLHRIGGDVVGMSTVPEVLVARHAGLQVFVASVVSNKCHPVDEIRKTTVEDVIRAVEAAEPKLTRILLELLPHLF